MVQIVSRARWGARPWSGTVHEVGLSERRYFVLHYHGAPPPAGIGYGVPQEVDRIHHANGWAGVGYNFLCDQAGTLFAGRGRDLVGAHCPGRNRDGIGVYLAVGGDQAPTVAAKRAVRALYDELCEQAGRRLVITWHGAHYPTACAGQHVNDWARAGMPVPATSRQEQTTMAKEVDLSARALSEVSRLVLGPQAYYRVTVPEGHGDPAAELADGRDAIPAVTALQWLVDGLEEARKRDELRAATQRRILDELTAIRALLDK